MKTREKRSLLFGIVFIGLICIVLVVLAAYAAQIRTENNSMIKNNEALQSEVDSYSVKIKESNSIEHIEKVAETKLNMVHPTSDQYVYITKKEKPTKNLAAVIREEAYN